MTTELRSPTHRVINVRKLKILSHWCFDKSKMIERGETFLVFSGKELWKIVVKEYPQTRTPYDPGFKALKHEVRHYLRGGVRRESSPDALEITDWI